MGSHHRHVEQQFADLARTTGEAAAHIECSQEEYKVGLEAIIEELESRVECVTEEIKQANRHAEHGGESG